MTHRTQPRVTPTPAPVRQASPLDIEDRILLWQAYYAQHGTPFTGSQGRKKPRRIRWSVSRRAVRCVETGQRWESYGDAARSLTVAANTVKRRILDGRDIDGLHYEDAGPGQLDKPLPPAT